MQHWRAGGATVMKVIETEGPMPAAFLFEWPDTAAVTAPAAWLAPHVRHGRARRVAV